MPEREAREGRPDPVELDIMRTFGWGVIALEETMYQRHLQLSAKASLMTREEFKSHLLDMESKGYLASTSLHGKRAFRRLLVNGDSAVSIHPRVPLDEMRLVLGSLKAKQDEREIGSPPATKKRRSRITSEVISESQMISEQIVDELEEHMLEDSGIKRKAAVHRHIENMLRALGESNTALFTYVKSEIPSALGCIGKILHTQGPDFLMLSLRLAEPQVRRYSS
ncbi:MAG: hypothetical protein P1Q69_14840 [Candidatus Thorarchaeota archaeon]|nr:hypothetical protein [Candidatus Thorarchaeota archaeon]